MPHKIVAHAPGSIRNYEERKLYLDENRVYESSLGSFLDLCNAERLVIPLMSIDSVGSYLATLSMVNSKYFKNVCNRCHHEWSEWVFDIWYSRCGNADWSTVRDRS